MSLQIKVKHWAVGNIGTHIFKSNVDFILLDICFNILKTQGYILQATALKFKWNFSSICPIKHSESFTRWLICEASCARAMQGQHEASCECKRKALRARAMRGLVCKGNARPRANVNARATRGLMCEGNVRAMQGLAQTRM